MLHLELRYVILTAPMGNSAICFFNTELATLPYLIAYRPEAQTKYIPVSTHLNLGDIALCEDPSAHHVDE